MIEFRPDITDGEVSYAAFESGENVGSARLTFSGTRCELMSVGAEDEETAEGLIRACLNAAGNRGAYSCLYKADAFSGVARSLGFEDSPQGLYGEIPFVLAGCCGLGKRQK